MKEEENLFLSEEEIKKRKIKVSYENYIKKKSSKSISKRFNRNFSNKK